MNPPFNAWKEGTPYYGPLLGAGVLLLLLAGGSTAGLVAGSLTLGVGLFTLYFFRDPVRIVTQVPEEIVAPADGTVVAIEDLPESPYYEGPCRRVSIFLSIFNVHINRAPFDGAVEDIAYRPGQFKNAMKAESSDCNEANTVRMATAHGPLTVRQVSGLVARRIICRRKVGDRLAKGEKFGMIRFGSRTELYLPAGTEVCVTLKEKVRAGASIVARF